jgi:hypothetical protein
MCMRAALPNRIGGAQSICTYPRLSFLLRLLRSLSVTTLFQPPFAVEHPERQSNR